MRERISKNDFVIFNICNEILEAEKEKKGTTGDGNILSGNFEERKNLRTERDKSQRHKKRGENNLKREIIFIIDRERIWIRSKKSYKRNRIHK